MIHVLGLDARYSSRDNGAATDRGRGADFVAKSLFTPSSSILSFFEADPVAVCGSRSLEFQPLPLEVLEKALSAWKCRVFRT